MDNKICFVQPPYGFFMQSLDAPFTLMYLAAVAEKCGWTATIVDMTTPEDPLPEADVYAVTSTSPQWKEAQKLSTRIAKEHPESLAIIGGVHVSACPEAFMSSDFHIAIQGEGEEPLTVMLNDLREHPELMKEYCIMRRGLEVKGIPVEDLDTVPFPARHLVDWSRYKRGIYWGKQKIADAVSMITSRGCPHDCAFCIPAGYEIALRNGRKIPIENIRKNDIIYSFNTETKRLHESRIIKNMKRNADIIYKITIQNDKEIELTGEHPVYTNRGWVKAKNLTELDEILTMED